jgi:two-component system, cell cycle response regulator CtrA
LRHTNRATFRTGARAGLKHGAFGIPAAFSCQFCAMRRIDEAANRGDRCARIPFLAVEKNIMNEVARLGHARIVLIEDDPESRASLQMLLEEEGAEVIAVADAEDGAEAAISHLPDAVICDLDLPAMDGFYLIQRLRDHEIRGNLPPCVAVALTGHGGEEYRLRSIGEGFQHFMTKPVRPDALVALIQTALNTRVVM